MSQQENKIEDEGERWRRFIEMITSSDDAFWIRNAHHVVEIWGHLCGILSPEMPPRPTVDKREEGWLLMCWAKRGHYIELEIPYEDGERPQYELFWYPRGIVKDETQNGVTRDELDLDLLIELLRSHMGFVAE